VQSSANVNVDGFVACGSSQKPGQKSEANF